MAKVNRGWGGGPLSPIDLAPFGLGLSPDHAVVVAWDPRWTAAADVLIAAVRDALGSWCVGIEHVGSTAVAGLAAKPILDLAVRLRELPDVDDVIERLSCLGLEYRGDKRDRGGHLFVSYSASGLSTAHVHVVTYADPAWSRYLAFRDLLRRDEGAREAYERAKRELAVRYPADRGAYRAAKDATVERLLGRAP